MVKKVTILFLFIYVVIVFGHSVASIGHHVLHLTAEIVALHDHGHSHNVSDHSEIFKVEEQRDSYKTAHFNMLSLVFFYQPVKTTSLVKPNQHSMLPPFQDFFKSTNQTPPTPPPIG